MIYRSRWPAALAAVASLALGAYGLALGYAHWLAYLPDVPGAEPRGPSARIARAAEFAPTHGSLALWTATEDTRRYAAGLLSPESEALATTATASAVHAVNSRPADPFAYIALAQILIRRASHPTAGEELADQLHEAAFDNLMRATTMYPASRVVATRAANLMLDQWPRLDDHARAATVAAIRRAATVDWESFGGMLGRLADAMTAGAADGSDYVRTLQAATPQASLQLFTLGRFLGQRNRGHGNADAALLDRVAVDSLAAAAELSGYLPGRSDAWLGLAAQIDGELERVLMELTAVNATDQVTAGSLYAEAATLERLGQRSAARDRAEESREHALRQLREVLGEVQAGGLPPDDVVRAARRTVRSRRDSAEARTVELSASILESADRLIDRLASDARLR